MYCALTLSSGGAELVFIVYFLASVCCDNITRKPVVFLQYRLVTPRQTFRTGKQFGQHSIPLTERNREREREKEGFLPSGHTAFIWCFWYSQTCPGLPRWHWWYAGGKEPACQCRRHKRCGFNPCVVPVHQPQATSTMHRTWTGEEGAGFGMGNTCIPVADSCWCMEKPIQYYKVISLQLK